jgi:hypothetical protein
MLICIQFHYNIYSKYVLRNGTGFKQEISAKRDSAKREDTEERAMYMNEERHLQADVKVGFPGNDCVVVHHAQT